MAEAGLKAGRAGVRTTWERVAAAILLVGLCVVCFDSVGKDPKSPWTKFVLVDGQPEPVPEQWVATPEGKFAHSIRIPNPVPKDSGYRRGMSSEQYFEHLCRTEAGEFIFKTVENVEGFYFMRPPKRPTDDDLKDRYKLEAPEIERTFQLLRAIPEERADTFVNPPWALFTFVEEPSDSSVTRASYFRSHGYRQGISRMKVDGVTGLKSQFGLTWRGVRRPLDREHAISGGEWIVLDLNTNEVVAVQRDYGLTGRTRNAPQGIWWLNAVTCPNSSSKHILPSRIYTFVTKSLNPPLGVTK